VLDLNRNQAASSFTIARARLGFGARFATRISTRRAKVSHPMQVVAQFSRDEKPGAATSCAFPSRSVQEGTSPSSARAAFRPRATCARAFAGDRSKKLTLDSVRFVSGNPRSAPKPSDTYIAGPLPCVEDARSGSGRKLSRRNQSYREQERHTRSIRGNRRRRAAFASDRPQSRLAAWASPKREKSARSSVKRSTNVGPRARRWTNYADESAS
jgi:hypothetical protein